MLIIIISMVKSRRKQKEDIITSIIQMVLGNDGNYQNIRVIQTIEEYFGKEEPAYQDLTWKIPLSGSLEIIKKDGNNGNALSGVKFKIKNKNANTYIKAEGKNGEYKYSTKSNAIETLETDKDGKIKVSNLPVGSYTIEETNPLDGYYVVNNSKDVQIIAEKTQDREFINYSYGKLKIIKSDKDEHDKRLENAEFQIKKGDQYVKAEKGNENYTYTGLGKEDEATTFRTNSNGCIEVVNLPQGWDYKIVEKKAPDGYEIIGQGETSVTVSGTKAKERTEYLKTYLDNITNDIKYPEEGSANYEKEKNDMIDTLWYIIMNTERQNNFDLFNRTEEGLQQLFKKNKSNKYNFISDIFDTYAKAELNYYKEIINQLNQESVLESGQVLPTYLKEAYYRVKNKNISDIDLEMWLYKVQGGTATVIYNKKSTVDLKGYVWIEKEDINGTWDSEKQEKKVTSANGNVIVKLVDNNDRNKIIASTNIDRYGLYQFKDIKKDELSKYHLEISYNGMTYQATNTNHAKSANGNVFKEDINKQDRQTFNNKFATIENNIAINSNGEVRKDLKYLENTNNELKQSKLVLGNNKTIDDRYITGVDNDYMITAQSDSITLENNKSSIGYYNTSTNTIEGLNLGIYLRDIPDIELTMNVTKVSVTVNGRSETYPSDIDKLPIYNADFQDSTFEMQITYQIGLTDKTKKTYTTSDYSQTKINSINFTTNIGDAKGIELLANGSVYVPKDSELIIYGTVTINKDNKDAIISSKDNEGNITSLKAINASAEICSYSTYNNSNSSYGGVDIDSQPGNLDYGKHEDDEAEVTIKEEIKQRTISGIVFEDNATGEIGAGKQRLGNGQYDENENKIEDVKVQLQIINDDKLNDAETIKGYKTIDATTNADGTFEITDFVAGRYKLVYTWGNDSKYNVVDYKSTIWSEDNRNSKNNPWWYTKTEPRYSDALDDLDTRTKIDKDNSTEKPTTMDATTNDMEVGINNGKIENIDFGLIERPRQKLDINKRVKHVTLTLANGQPIVDCTIDENGNKQDITGYVKYVAPNPNEIPWNGQLHIELENELIQGSILKVQYEIEVKNNSELDYMTENYYKYGTDKNNIVKLTPTKVYDYLDEIMPLQSQEIIEENEKWNNVDTKTSNDNSTLVNQYYNQYYSSCIQEDGSFKETISWDSIEQKEYKCIFEEWKNQSIKTIEGVEEYKIKAKKVLENAKLENQLAPGESNTAELNTSKKLAATDEITINNDTEIREVQQDYGRRVTPSSSILYDRGERVIVTPPTGQDKAYIVPITVAIVSLGILLGGIILIKKKVLE